jgi:hypothetical protein
MNWFKRIWEFLFGKPEQKPVVPPPSEKPVVKPGPEAPNFFRNALKYTFVNEGGFSNDPADYGGATNFGIIREELARWRGESVSASDVKNMKRDEAEAIYLAWYWKPLRLDEIHHEKVAIALFDRAVLNGLTGVSRHVRNIFPGKMVGDPPNFFPLIPLVNDEDPRTFVLKLADYCEAAHRERVKKDKSQEVFLAGWINRVNRMRRELV